MQKHNMEQDWSMVHTHGNRIHLVYPSIKNQNCIKATYIKCIQYLPTNYKPWFNVLTPSLFVVLGMLAFELEQRGCNLCQWRKFWL